jgi:hypothetical protein
MNTSALKPDLLNPDWEPSDEELEALMRSFIEDVNARAVSARASLEKSVAEVTGIACQAIQ